MRWLLSLIFIMVTLSSASAIETRTEYIKEEVCPAIAGCWMNALTGECPDCIIETRKIVTEIKSNEHYVPTGLELLEVETPTKRKIVEGCTVLVAGIPRPCDWMKTASKRAVVIERANKECGGFYKWKWTSYEKQSYVCKYRG